jgi:hypothetical protein
MTSHAGTGEGHRYSSNPFATSALEGGGCHNLYPSPNIRKIKLRTVRWASDVARMGNMRNAYLALVGKLIRTRPLGIPRNNRKDNIKMYLKEDSFGSG